MLKNKTLYEEKSFDLALPEDGFASEFLSGLSNISAKYIQLNEAYLTLKQSEDGVSLFFCFLFNDDIPESDQNKFVGNIMEEILGLFTEEMVIDAISLNGKDQLLKAVKSVTSPFFSR